MIKLCPSSTSYSALHQFHRFSFCCLSIIPLEMFVRLRFRIQNNVIPWKHIIWLWCTLMHFWILHALARSCEYKFKSHHGLSRTTEWGQGKNRPVESRSPAGAALLHDLCPVVSRQLAESVITVNYRPLHDLSISQQETCLCNQK